jgi:hypothetical protein
LREALLELRFGALAVEGVGNHVADDLEPLFVVRRPGPVFPEAAGGENARQSSADVQGDGEDREHSGAGDLFPLRLGTLRGKIVGKALEGDCPVRPQLSEIPVEPAGQAAVHRSGRTDRLLDRERRAALGVERVEFVDAEGASELLGLEARGATLVGAEPYVELLLRDRPGSIPH